MKIIDTKGKYDTRILIAISAAILLLLSCSPKYNAEKAIADVDKANGKYPAPVAEWLRKQYPCITRASDTVVLSRDSIVYIDCPDLPQIVHEPGSTDTVYKVQTKTVRVPVHLPIQTQYITTYIEDSAKIKAITVAYNELQAKYTLRDAQATGYEEQRNKLRWILFIIIGIAIGLTAWRVSKSLRPKISI